MAGMVQKILNPVTIVKFVEMVSITTQWSIYTNLDVVYLFFWTGFSITNHFWKAQAIANQFLLENVQIDRTFSRH